MDNQQPLQAPPGNDSQPIQPASQPLKPGDPGYTRTVTTGTADNQGVQTPDQEPRKTNKPLTVLLTIVFIIVAVVAGIFITQCREQVHADRYGADEPYTITGVVEKAKKDTRGMHNNYWTVIWTDQELPDGSYEFTSTASLDQTYAKKFLYERVEVEIGTDGHISKIKAIE